MVRIEDLIKLFGTRTHTHVYGWVRERERERKGGRERDSEHMYVYAHTHTHTSTHTHTHTHTDGAKNQLQNLQQTTDVINTKQLEDAYLGVANVLLMCC